MTDHILRWLAIFAFEWIVIVALIAAIKDGYLILAPPIVVCGLGFFFALRSDL